MATTMRSLSPAPTTRISLDLSRTFRTGLLRQIPAAPNQLEWGEWSAGAPTSFSYEIGTSAFGTDIGSGTVAQNAGNSVLLFTNGLGYGVYDVTVPVSGSTMTAGSTYWVSISNATDASNDGTQGWDIPNGGSGGPATCNFRQSGTNFGNCGLGGESFTLSATPPPPGRPLSPAASCCSVLASSAWLAYCAAS